MRNLLLVLFVMLTQGGLCQKTNIKFDNQKSISEYLIQKDTVNFESDFKRYKPNVNSFEELQKTYIKKSIEHRMKVLNAQYIISIIVFIVVIIVVFIGLYFSGKQFYLFDKGKNTSFEINKNGFKISSNVIGLLILFLSIIFFYLYLIYVFPISEIKEINF